MNRVSAAFLACLLAGMSGCGGAQTPPSSPSRAQTDTAASRADEETGETLGWSEVAETTAGPEDSNRPGRKTGKVVIQSDPDQHGKELHFDFSVNGTRMDGVFLVPGGQPFTFTLPAGSVSYGVAECGGAGGGFELEPGASVTLKCRSSGRSECCGLDGEDEQAPARPQRGQQKSKVLAPE
ncbi:MAG: hypothetical protein WBM17_17390 [Anaerolineales bacterium]